MNEITSYPPLDNQQLEEKQIKINASLRTEAPSQIFLRKKISLTSCASSKSMMDHGSQTKQSNIMANFLFVKNYQERAAIFSEMENAYNQKIQNQEEILTFPSIESSNKKQSNKVIEHFIGSWLLSMGYKEDKNKKYYFNRMKMYVSHENLYLAIKFYESLGESFFQAEERKQFLIEVCKNGWEYFIQKGSDKIKSFIERNQHNQIKQSKSSNNTVESLKSGIRYTSFSNQ